MSDARAIVKGYVDEEMPPSANHVRAKGTNGAVQLVVPARPERPKGLQPNFRRAVGRRYGISLLPRYETVNLEIVDAAARRSRRGALRAQAIGSAVAVIVTVVLLVVSANGAVIALATIVSGMTAGQVAARVADRRVAATSSRRSSSQLSDPATHEKPAA